MGKIKQLLIRCADELDIPDTRHPAVMALAKRKMEAMVKPKQMCEFCQEEEAEEDSFFCESCREGQWAAFEPVEYTAQELDDMEDAYYQQKDAESLVDPDHPEYGKAKIE